jgi:glycosyltransferase involved in cell wall biosynthesis
MWFCVSKVLVKHFSEKRVNVIFAINKELMELIIRSYDVSPDKFRIIPLGADPTLFKFRPHARTSIRKKLGFSSKDVVIVYSGKIYPSKGLDLLLEAAHPIISQNRHLKLLVVGKFTQPEYEKEIHSLISHLDLSHNITFLPWVHRTKLADFYSASDIAVWPGASSISIIEAASVGLPIVIADYPLEIHAIAYGNGFTFRIGDIAGLRKCLGLLASNGKLRRQMGHKSRLIVKEKLNWQIISKQYFDTYLTTLKGSQSPIKEHLADARPRRYELLVIS